MSSLMLHVISAYDAFAKLNYWSTLLAVYYY